MSFINKARGQYNAEIDDDNDSFHSFAQSDNDPSDLSSLSNVDDSNGTGEIEFEVENAGKIKSSPQTETQTSESSDVSGSMASVFVESPLQCQPPKLKCHYMVPKLADSSKMPDVDVFDMNVAPSASSKKALKAPLDVSPKTEALQKYAFTEIWIEEQQSHPAPQRSLNREFTAALENYFNSQKTDQFANLSLDEWQKGKINKEQLKSSTALTASFQTLPENEPYVSPFEDMPPVPEEKAFPGQKPYIVVPAGFDITNLVEYKDPNHWHRRPTTRNVSRP